MIDSDDRQNLPDKVPEHIAAADRWSRVINTAGALCALAVLLGAVLVSFVQSASTLTHVAGVLAGCVAASITWAGFRLTAVLTRGFSATSNSTYASPVYRQAPYETTQKIGQSQAEI